MERKLLGTKTLVNIHGSYYILVPKALVDIIQSKKFQIYFDPETNEIIYRPTS